MTEVAEELKTKLLSLPTDDRAELAYFLLRSLENEKGDTGATWEAELERRWQEVENGTAQGIPAEDVLDALRKEFP